MTDGFDLIWILDCDADCLHRYQEILGLQYKLRVFSGVDEYLEALAAGESPRLLISDPDCIQGSFVKAIDSLREKSGTAPRMPECMIVSACDDLDLMRFYFKAGVRDFVFKPIRPNELIAKVERVLQQISNCEVLILRNNLDGIQIPDLTFREHQMLTVFLTRPNRSVSRDELHKAIWTTVSVNRKTLDVHLFNLRRKIRVHGYDILCKDHVFSLNKIDDSAVTAVKGASLAP